FSTPEQSERFVERLAAAAASGSLAIVSDVDEALTHKRSTLADPAVLPGVPALWRLFGLLGVPSGGHSGRAAHPLMALFAPEPGQDVPDVVGLFGAQHAPAGATRPDTRSQLLDPAWSNRLIEFLNQYYTPQHEAAGINPVFKRGPDGQLLVVAFDW